MSEPSPSWNQTSLNYPAQLPVTDRREDILSALREHQVVVIAGETGSGKTTQIPKMCLELGRGQGLSADGLARKIGHTQPRRIAARSVAERLAEELNVPLGEQVGYQVRFTDTSSERTQIKVMTDGVLLNELHHDRDLSGYDTIIVDEAHERSLNIDFLLGYLASLLPRRPDLKLVITSATIDTERFAQHFESVLQAPVPIIEVSGRTYPVEVRYRPLGDSERAEGAGAGSSAAKNQQAQNQQAKDQVTGIIDAVDELWRGSPRSDAGPQDILVFCSGERDINEASAALKPALRRWGMTEVEILPLYARLSSAQQHAIFARHEHRRIVLATNVAETSLTVPGIRYVIDTGRARISRYSQRLKVQRLPIEAISQASANQRMGRCGRLADGICIRLFSEDDFTSRPEFTDPEILRTSLASVILSMAAIGLGRIERFPFVQAPDSRQIGDAVRLLEELHAVKGPRGDGSLRLTPTGRTLARLPLDPRLGRMLIAAQELGCVSEVLVIVSALSLQDVREVPSDNPERAQQLHARFASEQGDFASILALWQYLHEQQEALSSSAFRRLTKAEFIHYLRVREWRDLHAQLARAARSARLDPHSRTGDWQAEGIEASNWPTIHQAILTGLLSHIGQYEECSRDYLGARGARWAIGRGSALRRKAPSYAMAAELIETARLYGRVIAPIDPHWAEAAGAHLVKRSYSSPHWSSRQGSAMAKERVMLYGVSLASDRPISLGSIDPELARELFIRHALVEGDWRTRHAFFAANAELLDEVRALEERSRRRDLVIDDGALYSFYDARIPADVTSAAHFDSWARTALRERPQLLHLRREDLLIDPQHEVSHEDFPHEWTVGGHTFELTYSFDPGATTDGITISIPVELLNQISESEFSWQVPGVREELVTALLRTLPKAHRRGLVPIPDSARALLPSLHEGDHPLTEALAAAITSSTGARVAAADFDLGALPDHLRLRYSITDGARELGHGKDLAQLQARFGGRTQSRLSASGAQLERAGLVSWELGTADNALPARYEREHNGRTIVGYPALVPAATGADLRVLTHEAIAQAVTPQGVASIIAAQAPLNVSKATASLSPADKLTLAASAYASVEELVADAGRAVIAAIVDEHGPISMQADHDAALRSVRSHLQSRVASTLALAAQGLSVAEGLDERLESFAPAAARHPGLAATLADARAQRDGLLRAGFVAHMGAQLAELARYLHAIERRLERAGTDPSREGAALASIEEVEGAFTDLLEDLPEHARSDAQVRAIEWMIEELRVQLLAPGLPVKGPVSVPRLLKACAGARARLLS